MSKQAIYGYPSVSDPNDFEPDPECSSPQEMELHRLACANFGKPAYAPNKGCYSERSADGQLVKHVARTSWGLGVNLIDTCDGCHAMTFGEPLIACHECGGPEFCAGCWPKHEKEHDEQ